ncbi:hypothetical protein H6F73_16560 [Microcoleus sp. FACHB-68]|nr:hypothetical protein [Microcoleus sp. FACHB-68]
MTSRSKLSRLSSPIAQLAQCQPEIKRSSRREAKQGSKLSYPDKAKSSNAMAMMRFAG